MKEYIPSIEQYGVVAKRFNTEVIGFAMNLVVDKEGNLAAKTNTKLN